MFLPYPGLKIANRGTQGRVLVSASFLGALLLRQPCQLALQVVIHSLLDGANCEKQGTISHLAGFSTHLGWFYIDKSLVLQLPYVFHNRVSAHPGILANAPYAGPALVRFPVLAENQVGIDR